jgi:multimeric flavodoxin WrbA
MILGICGSGRKDGNTGALVEEVLKAAGTESELVWLIDINLGYCTGCWRCVSEGKCWQEDGMTELYKKMLDCDAMVIGSPCYYGEVSGLVKSMMDRSIALGYMGVGKESETSMHGSRWQINLLLSCLLWQVMASKVLLKQWKSLLITVR